MASPGSNLRKHYHPRNYLQSFNCIKQMKNSINKTAYSQMQRFANITKTFIIQGNIGRAKRCLQTAEEIFNLGTAEIKNAVANVYVYSISSFMEIHYCNIKNLFPESLKAEYQKQINTSYP